MNADLNYNTITIRRGVFETNSSSTHSLVVVPQPESNNTFIYDGYTLTEAEYKVIMLDAINKYNEEHEEKIIVETIDEAIEKFKETDFYADNCYDLPKTLEEWCESDFLLTEEYEYTTPKGEQLKIYCKYGFDG